MIYVLVVSMIVLKELLIGFFETCPQESAE